MSGRFASDAALSAGRQAAQVALLFVLTPFVVSQLGDEGYGLWTLAISALGFLALLDLGFSLAVVRLVARSAEGTVEQRNERLSTVFAFFLCLSALAAIATWGIQAWLSHSPGIPESLRDQIPTLIVLMGLRHGVLLLPLSFFRGLLFGAQRFRLLNATQFSISLMQGLATWWVLSAGHGLIGLASVQLACMLLEHLVYLFASLRWVPGLCLTWRLVNIRVLPELASFSAWTLVGSVASLILLRTDPLIVKSSLPLAAVTLYGLALKIAEAFLLVLKQVVNLLSPLAADMQARGDVQGLRRTLIDATRTITAVALALAIPLAILAEEFLLAWVGHEQIGAAPVLSILVVSIALAMPQLIASAMMSMSGFHRRTGLLAAGMAVCNLGLSWVLIGPLGLIGPALATLISVLVFDLILAPRLACHAFGVRQWTYYRQAMLPLIPLAAATAIATVFVQQLCAPESLWSVALCAGLGSATFLLCAWRAKLLPNRRSGHAARETDLRAA